MGKILRLWEFYIKWMAILAMSVVCGTGIVGIATLVLTPPEQVKTLDFLYSWGGILTIIIVSGLIFKSLVKEEKIRMSDKIW